MLFLSIRCLIQSYYKASYNFDFYDSIKKNIFLIAIGRYLTQTIAVLKGFAQLDTTEDAHYYGKWLILKKL